MDEKEKKDEEEKVKTNDTGKLTGEKSINYAKEISDKIKSKQLMSMKPMEKDRGSFRSDAYQIWNVVYNADQSLVKNIFQCIICDKVLHIYRKNGLGPLRNHKCYKKYNEKQVAEKAAMESAKQLQSDSSSSACLTVNPNTLAKCFSFVSTLGHTYGPIESDEVKKILPSTSTEDKW